MCLSEERENILLQQPIVVLHIAHWPERKHRKLLTRLFIWWWTKRIKWTNADSKENFIFWFLLTIRTHIVFVVKWIIWSDKYVCVIFLYSSCCYYPSKMKEKILHFCFPSLSVNLSLALCVLYKLYRKGYI